MLDLLSSYADNTFRKGSSQRFFKADSVISEMKSPKNKIFLQRYGDIFAGISCFMKRRMLPSWQFLSYLNGETYSSILNRVCGKEESSFVSETIRMSIYHTR